MSSIEVQLVCDFASNILDVQPASIILTGPDDTVTWVCPNLPAGGKLEVGFSRGPYGPFSIIATDGEAQVGAGNVGPDLDGRNDYPYQAIVHGGGAQWEGSGTVVNLSQEAGSNPIGGTCKPVDPPGTCTQT